MHFQKKDRRSDNPAINNRGFYSLILKILKHALVRGDFLIPCINELRSLFSYILCWYHGKNTYKMCLKESLQVEDNFKSKWNRHTWMIKSAHKILCHWCNHKVHLTLPIVWNKCTAAISVTTELLACNFL